MTNKLDRKTIRKAADESCKAQKKVLAEYDKKYPDGPKHFYTTQLDTEIEANEFITNCKIVKQWFADEEMEISDFVVGHMALKLKALIEREVEKAKKEMELPFGISSAWYSTDKKIKKARGK